MKFKEVIFQLFAAFYPLAMLDKLAYYKSVILSCKFASKLAACGKGTRFSHIEFVTGLDSISIGNESIFLPHLFLTTWGVRKEP